MAVCIEAASVKKGAARKIATNFLTIDASRWQIITENDLLRGPADSSLSVGVMKQSSVQTPLFLVDFDFQVAGGDMGFYSGSRN